LPEKRGDKNKPTCCKKAECKREGELHRNGHIYFPQGFCRYHYRKMLRDAKKIQQ